MEHTPSEATMRLVRARTLIHTTAERVTALATLDCERYGRIEGQFASLRFDPVMDEARADADAQFVDEACRLASLVAIAASRLVRHLEERPGA